MPELNPIAARYFGDGRLHINFIDVGLGDCTYIVCPNGKRILIDAGSTNAQDVTLGDIQQYLDYDAATRELRVDVMVMSHGHQDHYNLLRHLVGASSIQWVYHGGNIGQYNGYEFRKWWYMNANVQNMARLDVNVANPAIVEICDGTVAGPGNVGCHVEVLAASVVPTTNNTLQWVKNTESVVVRITFGNDVILIPGDATTDTEAFMIGQHGNAALNADTLRVPHHGSPSSSSVNFIAAVQAQNAVISCSDGNTHGLPKRSVVNNYLAQNSLAGGQPNHAIGTYDDVGGNPRNYLPTNTVDSIWQTGISGSFDLEFNGV